MENKYFLTPLIILLFFQISNCFAQTLFFEELDPSIWISTKRINDSTLKTVQEIQLSKLQHSKESLRQDAMLWSFKSGILTLSEYDSALKKEFIVSKYPYTIDFGKGILSIEIPDDVSLNYKAGITSTETFAVLNRMKEKNKKDGKTSR